MNALRLVRFDERDQVPAGEVADLVLENTCVNMGQGMVATDMDNTMFRDNIVTDAEGVNYNVTGDMGILVFLEKLQDPAFWRFSPERFKGLLLPQAYRNFARANLYQNGKYKNLLDLTEDIAQVYSILKRIVTNSEPGVELNFTHPVVSEFALKMLAFDDQVKGLEGAMVAQGVGMILMRVRFFAGSDKAKAVDLTKRVLARTADDTDAKVKLSSHPRDVKHTGGDLGLPYDNLVNDIPDANFLRIVQVNEGVRRLLARLSVEFGIPTYVVSANMKAIARTAAENHPKYSNIVAGTTASLLTENKKGLGPRFVDDRMLHGQPKVGAIQSIQALLPPGSKKLVAAFGDSLYGDGPMMRHALEKGGIAVITGPTIEGMQRNFAVMVEQAAAEGVSGAPQRTFMLPYS